MALTCSCDNDYEWFYSDAKEIPLVASRSKRCQSCNDLVKPGATVVRFCCYRPSRTDLEENIHGSEIYLADKYLCERCGDLWWTFDELGFCMVLGNSMTGMAKEYGETYGPKT